MAFPIALIPVAISAVVALIKLRGRVDNILSVKAASDRLPFALPPAPPSTRLPDVPDMIAFFAPDDLRRAPEGPALLEFTGKKKDFEAYLRMPEPRPRQQTDIYLTLFSQATGREGTNAGQLARDPTKAIIDYYLVDSYRLSNNPASVRILLATADTILEFGGANAALFISNPKTASIVGTLLREFAGRQDFDDENLETIFRSLLGSAVVTALEHKEELPEHPPLLVLYAALGEVREAKGDNFAATIISADGFEATVAAYFKAAVSDPQFQGYLEKIAGIDDLDDAELTLVRGAFAGLLTELGENAPTILRDPKAMKGVLEAAITGAAANASPLLRTLEGDRPLLAAVLQAVVQEIARDSNLFDSLGNGELIGDIYGAALAVVAKTPDLDGDGVTTLVEAMVSALVDELSEQSLERTLTDLKAGKGETYVNRLLARAVFVLGEHPEVLVGRNHAYAKAVLGALLKAAAPLLEDGLEQEDFIALLQQAVTAASGNLTLIEMDSTVRVVVMTVGTSISQDHLAEKLTSPESRKDMLLVALAAVAANPKVWQRLQERDLVQPLVEGMLEGLRADPSSALSGPSMVAALKESLEALSRRGTLLLDDALSSGTVPARAREVVKATVEHAVAEIDAEIGKTITGEQVPAFLGRVLSVAFKAGLSSHQQVSNAVAQVRTGFDRA